MQGLLAQDSPVMSLTEMSWLGEGLVLSSQHSFRTSVAQNCSAGYTSTTSVWWYCGKATLSILWLTWTLVVCTPVLPESHFWNTQDAQLAFIKQYVKCFLGLCLQVVKHPLSRLQLSLTHWESSLKLKQGFPKAPFVGFRFVVGCLV